MDVIDYANFHDAFYNATRHIKLDATKMTDSDWRHMASHPGRIFETSFFKNPNTGALEIPDVTNMSPAELRIWMMNFYLDTLDSSYNEPAKELIDQDHPGRLSPLSHAQEFAKFVSESSFNRKYFPSGITRSTIVCWRRFHRFKERVGAFPRAGVVTNSGGCGWCHRCGVCHVHRGRSRRSKVFCGSTCLHQSGARIPPGGPPLSRRATATRRD